MKIGSWSRQLLSVGAGILVFSGFSDLAVRSSGSSSWADETSFMSINIRSRGSMKIGLGMGMFGIAFMGMGNLNQSNQQNHGGQQFAEGKEATSSDDKNYEICVEIYRENGGEGTPNKSNSSILAMIIVLVNDYGEPLARFTRSRPTKDSAGTWSMTFLS